MSSSKIFKGIALFVGGQVGFFSCYLPNTTFLDEMQKFTHGYKEMKPIPVSEKVKSLFDEVMNDMKVAEENKQEVQLYTYMRLDFFHAGSTWKNRFIHDFKKAIIGIPPYFNWEIISDEIKETLKFGSEILDWGSSEDSKKLENSLLISDKAKKFALAQNLCYVSSAELFFNSGISMAAALISVQYVFSIITSENLQHKRFKTIKYAAAAFTLIINATLWVLCKDMYRCRMETNADEAVAKLGKDYIEGGVEYYNSILDKNMALRNMTSASGKFSLFGNVEMTLRQKHLPITGRRDYFKKLLEQT